MEMADYFIHWWWETRATFNGKKILPVETINSSVIFIECTELTYNRKDSNGLFLSFKRHEIVHGSYSKAS